MADYRVFQLRLNHKSDAMRIAWLERQVNVTEAIRGLIDGARAGVGAGAIAPTTTDGGQCDATVIAQIVRATVVSVFDEKMRGAMLATNTATVTVDPDDLDNELGADLDAKMMDF